MNDIAPEPRKPRIAVIGDPIKDIYYFVRPEGICLEGQSSGVPIYRIKETKTYWGGAANVAFITGSMGADVYLWIPVAATDLWSRVYERDSYAGNYPSEKIRVWGRELFCRIDNEGGNACTHRYHTGEGLALKVLKFDPDVIVFIDYGKGAFDKTYMEQFIQAYSGAGTEPVYVIDPKDPYVFKLDLDGCDPCIFYTPNTREVEKTGLSAKDLSMHINHSSYIIETKGEKGCACYHKGGEVVSYPSVADKVVDTCGAGEVFSAVLAYHLSRGKSVQQAIVLANQEAGKSVAHIGCSHPHL